MDQYEFMRVAHRVYGKSIGEHVQVTGHSRNTVRKALRGEPWRCKEWQHQPFPVLGLYLGHIDSWLEQDKGQQRSNGIRLGGSIADSGRSMAIGAANLHLVATVRFARINLGLDPSNKVFP